MQTKEFIKTYFRISNLKEEAQNQLYEGLFFHDDTFSYRSRLAKKTPKKEGYFVSFWEKKRR